MNVEEAVDIDSDDDAPAASTSPSKLVPMPASSGISDLREKLHARMAALRRGNRGGGDADDDGDGEAGSRDELLEQRRKQRAEMRERRRKETREKIRREQESRGKKSKDKEAERARHAGPSTKVRFVFPSYTCVGRRN